MACHDNLPSCEPSKINAQTWDREARSEDLSFHTDFCMGRTQGIKEFRQRLGTETREIKVAPLIKKPKAPRVKSKIEAPTVVH